jgi:hypothetical protein
MSDIGGSLLEDCEGIVETTSEGDCEGSLEDGVVEGWSASSQIQPRPARTTWKWL